MPENRYSEVIEFCYAESTLDFNHLQSITHLLQIVTPHRFSLITTIRLHWWTPERLFSPKRPLESANVARMWGDAWFIVARMWELHIVMCDGRGLFSFEEQFLSPLTGGSASGDIRGICAMVGKVHRSKWYQIERCILKRDHDYTAMTGGE